MRPPAPSRLVPAALHLRTPQSQQRRPPARARPMGAHLPRLPREASILPAQGNTTVVEKPAARCGTGKHRPQHRKPLAARCYAHAKLQHLYDCDTVGSSRYAAAVGISLQTITGRSDDIFDRSEFGMVASRFDGAAVVFLATTSFKLQSTASLR